MNGYSVLVVYVNGRKIVEQHPHPEWTLLYYLRTKLRLNGCKEACGEGGCGACTVMVSKCNRKTGKIEHIPVNACIAPLCSMHGLAITTVEGIGSILTKLHPIQERLTKAHGSQCGFCTPGMVMSMYTLLRNMPQPSLHDLEIALQGNLCRCTGYRPILEAFQTFARNECAMGEKCCKKKGNACENVLYDAEQFAEYKPEQELIFPPELKLIALYDQQSLHFQRDGVAWYRPTNLKRLLELKATYPHGKLVAGNTELAIDAKFKQEYAKIFIAPHCVDELNECAVLEDGVRIGGAVSLLNLDAFLRNEMSKRAECEVRVHAAILDMLQWFGGKQIRSVATLAGAIMTGSPISDVNPILIACGATLEVRSASSRRRCIMDEKFFTAYRKNIIEPHEIIESIFLPFTHKNHYFLAHKQSRRRDDDIAIVNVALNVILTDDKKIEVIKMAFGGLSTMTVTSRSLGKLVGREWNDSILNDAYDSLLTDLPLDDDAPGGMVAYRRTLPMSFFYRCYMHITSKLNNTLMTDTSAINKFKYEFPSGTQFYALNEDNSKTAVGQPVVHASGYKHATGEAIYLDDLPHFEDEAFVGLVLSEKAHAKVKSIDWSEALKVHGVLGYVSAADIPKGRNRWGAIVQDEEIIVSDIVKAQGQILGGICAVDSLTANKAKKLVKVDYEMIEPVIVTINDAIAHQSFYPHTRQMVKGNAEKIFKESEVRFVVEGECRTGIQDHFYFETHACLAIPKEENEIELIASTQDLKFLTLQLANLLDIPLNRIIARTKRIGGGFGGKETRPGPLACTVALAARKFKRPVRCVLSRDEDLQMMGGRNAFLIKYKAAFDQFGKIRAMDNQFYSNAGHSLDYSVFVMERALHHADNAYTIDHITLNGSVCKTNLPSNTSYRGFGVPQANFAMEYAIRDVAECLQKEPVDVALMNLHREGDLTCYNQEVVNCRIRDCYEECLKSSKYFQRKAEIEEWNKLNRWKKRGISVTCTRFGAGYGMNFLQQGGALVIIYVDGSVMLSHGGVEMGQGLHTKMLQVASTAFGIPIERIYTHDACTDKVPNTTATSASISSDLNGMAILQACETIKKRLQPLIAAKPQLEWNELIQEAYMQRISLSATGYYCEPVVDYDMTTNSGRLHNYFTFGAACSEVIIDCLTGDHQIVRTDIVMDVGKSLNPAIDIGQIEGAFMQGYGFLVMEEMLYSPAGNILTKGPSTYKIPSFGDIPIEFNVALLKSSANPRAIHSSKAIGEPPLSLASSVFFAIREAINSARFAAGVTSKYRLQAPATCERIRMGCVDEFTTKANYQAKSAKKWNVVP